MASFTQPMLSPHSERDARQAEVSGVALQRLLADADQSLLTATLRVRGEHAGGKQTELELPGMALPLLIRLLRELGNGKSIAVLTTDTEVTIRQAADMLNLSRRALVELLDDQRIPFRRVGTQRRMLLADVLRYKEQEEERHRGLDELVAEAERCGMY